MMIPLLPEEEPEEPKIFDQVIPVERQFGIEALGPAKRQEVLADLLFDIAWAYSGPRLQFMA